MEKAAKRTLLALGVSVVVAGIAIGLSRTRQVRNSGTGNKASGEELYCAVDDQKLGRSSALPLTFQGGTYYVHSEKEKEDFLKDPERYAFGWDIVCNSKQNKAMDVKDGTQVVVQYQGKTYYLCAKQEKEQFLSNPKKYLTSRNTSPTESE